jgi:hypothetical protein
METSNICARAILNEAARTQYLPDGFATLEPGIGNAGRLHQSVVTLMAQ